ncbi:anthranilate synthase component I family protein [cyanobiont of Ornithocercus magnificus]|nr:anthranilate synthase component I family protein [cyanobiont of Ornithocercus magnificus]
MSNLQRKQVAWRDPADIARQLAREYGEHGLIWLDGDGSALGRWGILAADPLEQYVCYGLPGVPGATDPFAMLESLGPGYWCGWLSYEAAAWLEPKNSWRADVMATLWIARYDPILRLDLQKHKLWIEGSDRYRCQAVVDWLASPLRDSSGVRYSGTKVVKPFGLDLGAWQWDTDIVSFTDGVSQLRELIAAGDLFQANLSTCCRAKLPDIPLSMLEMFLRLRRHCPAPFAGLMVGNSQAADEAVLSASPERFLHVDPQGHVETRPIKGTRPRHPDLNQDANLAVDLVCSLKDRSENIMIVDLLRNDLGRVCCPGSVQVTQLLGLESYPQVHHLTSVVEGQLASNHSWVDLLRACWPGGSVTGAPKLRACQRLQELETTSRGPYCGSLLLRNWDGSLDSNILIRSLFRKGSMLRAHAGCGIVADSYPNTELQELHWKLQPLLQALA